MSPEQLRGGERITAASDIYSLGVMAYEMVTGRRPFNPTSAPQLLEMHHAGVRVNPIDLRTNLSTEAQAIILRALSFERTARYQSAAEFGDSLARALLNEEETARHNVRRPETASASRAQLNGAGTFQPEVGGSRQSLFATRDNFSANAATAAHRRFSKTQFAVIGGFLIAILGVLGVLWITNRAGEGKPENIINTAESSPAPATRSFIYSLTVQKMHAQTQNVFQSTGQDTFDTGDKFRLNVFSSTPGYVYVFNEGTPEPNRSSFTIIYPTTETNNGSASVGADQWMRTSWNRFQGQAGTENLWIAWSTAPIPELEDAKTEAFNRKGMLIDRSLDAVKAFLTAKQEECKPKLNREKSSQQTTVRGTGDVVVKMLPLKHR